MKRRVLGFILAAVAISLAIIAAHECSRRVEEQHATVKRVGVETAVPSHVLPEEQFATIAPLLSDEPKAPYRPRRSARQVALVSTLAVSAIPTFTKPTPISIRNLSVPDGTVYTVACDPPTTTAHPANWDVVGHCVTIHRACNAMLNLTSVQHPCAWGRDEEGWESFTWLDHVVTEDDVKRRAVRP